MTTSVAISADVLTIHSLDVSDGVVVNYIGQLEQGAQAAGVLNCLQLGARALTFTGDQTGAALLADTLKSSVESSQSLLSRISKNAEESIVKSGETIQKTIARLLLDLDKELSSKLDPANTASIVGKLRTALIEDCQKVTERVRQDFDLANPQSPLSSLRTELEKGEERRFEALTNQLGELLQRLAAKGAAAAERSKSTLKGADFEAVTEAFPIGESRPRKDLVRRTSGELGLDQNMIGDFVIDVNPGDRRNLRLVIECKNGPNTTASLVRELDKAMQNRGAAFGLSVATDPTVSGEAVYPIGDDKYIVRVPPSQDGDGWDFMALGVALECARWKATMAQTGAGSLDINRIKADIAAAVCILNRFAEAKRKITAVRNQLDTIPDYLDEMRNDLNTTLHRVKDSITAEPGQDEAA